MVGVDEVLRRLGEHVGTAEVGHVLAVIASPARCSLPTFVHAGARQYLVADGYAVQYGADAAGGSEQVTYRSGVEVGRTNGPG